MPIFLRTGKPGAGKTLSVVEYLIKEFIPGEEKRFKADCDKLWGKGYLGPVKPPRPVFTDINGLTIPSFWVDVHGNEVKIVNDLDDPLLWSSLPHRSLIVMDEAQGSFPVRNSGSPIPPHISALNTHRHFGYDFILITQGLHLLDSALRPLFENHFHYKRLRGTSAHTRLEYDSATLTPEPALTIADAIKKRSFFDKSIFDYYKSSVEHNVKARVPWKKILPLIFGISVCLIGLYFAIDRVKNPPGSISVPSPDVDQAGTAETSSIEAVPACSTLVGLSAGRLMAFLPDGTAVLSGSRYSFSLNEDLYSDLPGVFLTKDNPFIYSLTTSETFFFCSN